MKNIFEAKSVPLTLVAKIKNTRDFHVVDWPAVTQSVTGELKSFDFYFSYVVEIAERLETLGII